MGFIPKRKDKKGDNGKVLVIGGSTDYIGAPYLAGMAALRTGCDIVTIAAPKEVAWTINSYSPDIITKKLEGSFISQKHTEELIQLANNFDVVVIGNGIGTRKETQYFVKEFILNCPKPKIIDADAIKLLKGDVTNINNAILTPHEYEFYLLTDEKLSGTPEKKSEIIKLYSKYRRVILLKGKTDIIVENNNIEYNKTGTPAMTIGGTGDVLAGICASLLSQTKDFFGSAKNAAYLNGKAGEYLEKKKGTGFTASDIIKILPNMRKKYL